LEDPAGNVAVSPGRNYDLDTTATIGSIDLLASSDTGVSDTDNISSDTTPTFRVNLGADAEVGDRVILQVGGTDTSAARTLTSGDLSNGFVNLNAPSANLSEGNNSVRAKFQDVAGNTATSSGLTYTLDTTTASLRITGDNRSNVWDNDFNIYGNASNLNPGQVIELNVEGVRISSASGNGGWSTGAGINFTSGRYHFYAQSTDTAGNSVTSNERGLTVRDDDGAIVTMFQGSTADIGRFNDGSLGTLYNDVNISRAGFRGDEASAMVDVDGDGRLDLVYVESGRASEVYLGNGNGTFRGQTFGSNIGNVGYADNEYTLFGDFNNDGRADILFLLEGQTGIYYGEAGGTFSGRNTPGFESSFNVGTSVEEHTGVGDFNGDGNLDVISVIDGNRRYETWFGNGNGTFGVGAVFDPAGITLQGGRDGNEATLFGDVNNDGRDDIVWLLDGGTLRTYLSNGDGSFREGAGFGKSWNGDAGDGSEERTFLYDVNDDGNLDIVWAFNDPGREIEVYYGFGNGDFNGNGDNFSPFPNEVGGIGDNRDATFMGDITNPGTGGNDVIMLEDDQSPYAGNGNDVILLSDVSNMPTKISGGGGNDVFGLAGNGFTADLRSFDSVFSGDIEEVSIAGRNQGGGGHTLIADAALFQNIGASFLSGDTNDTLDFRGTLNQGTQTQIRNGDVFERWDYSGGTLWIEEGVNVV
jgi:hypothetical protein